jgi:DNA-binding GntR family transcriptional regulator
MHAAADVGYGSGGLFMRISAHTVCTAIRDDIVAGVLPPGSRLAEEQLAQRYGVSRVPVREALRTLESEGFVVSRRHAGACVAQPGDREAADLLDIRALLEPLGAARAAQRRTEAHLKVLRGLVRLGRQRAGQGQEADLRSLGDWFHETVAQATCSPGLTAAAPWCCGRSAARWSTPSRAATRSGPGRWPPPSWSGPPSPGGSSGRLL